MLQTHRGMSSSTLTAAVVMRCFISFTRTGSGGTKLSLINPHKKKSQGVGYRLLGGQHISVMFWSVERPIQHRCTRWLEEFACRCLVSGCCLNYKEAVPHWHKEFRNYLDQNLPRRWIGHSADLTSCYFFLWGFIKVRVFVPPLPVKVNNLKRRIITAAASVDEDMLRCVRNELDYRIDICRVKKGSRKEHLQLTHTNLKTYTKKTWKYFAILIILWFLQDVENLYFSYRNHALLFERKKSHRRNWLE
jgi:hypothetical protein